ncbi:MAG: UDP-N-acetylglucosamine--N-acetylmuramyl-(pentapeptide) pyrophosphoryl-undecaprenol N-acetylglucosamine transferase [Planctomycetes bacterium]|nr:UDP-N-acetylglucosamine--N-acetylmuramyl-(pentapeptide) pyrophosphoryl-undecaprenol N-acetylglucosamine transferase [Planctomycetota bacterium]
MNHAAPEHPVILLCGGGTGGHLAPGVAVAEALLARWPLLRVVFATAGRAVEERMIPGRFERLPLPSLRWLGWRALARTARGALDGWRAAREAVLRLRPVAAVGLGGYASYLPARAAAAAGVPLFLLEQNVVSGRATRRLARAARAVCLPWPGVDYRLPRGVLTGLPVRHEALATPRAARAALLVTGGSQGSAALNRFLASHVANIARRADGLRVVHLAGDNDPAPLEAAYAAAGVSAVLRRHTRAMGAVYATARLALARAGGSTLAELAANRIPSVLVPYPDAKDDHQRANASLFAQAGAAVVLEESALDASAAEAIGRLWGDGERLRGMASAARRIHIPGAAQRVADLVIQSTLTPPGGARPSEASHHPSKEYAPWEPVPRSV